jgi:uncharacterized repeat protein (TIGR01451 family)
VNESKTVVVKLKAEAVGVIRSDATATAECAADVNDVTTTAVLGIPAILLELIDSGDPAEIGDMITYTITATNQGSAPDTNISIVAIIPGGQELIGTDGPTEGRLVRGRTLTFATLASIGVGAKAQWQIKVRAAKRSDVRFEVSMTSDNLRASGAVRETEATTMY